MAMADMDWDTDSAMEAMAMVVYGYGYGRCLLRLWRLWTWIRARLWRLWLWWSWLRLRQEVCGRQALLWLWWSLHWLRLWRLRSWSWLRLRQVKARAAMGSKQSNIDTNNPNAKSSQTTINKHTEPNDEEHNFKRVPDHLRSWTCAQCGYSNPLFDSQCKYCNTEHPFDEKAKSQLIS